MLIGTINLLQTLVNSIITISQNNRNKQLAITINFKLNVRLVIHHIDYTKENCATDNLITLCISCNSRANHKRESWKKFYKRVLHMNSL